METTLSLASALVHEHQQADLAVPVPLHERDAACGTLACRRGAMLVGRVYEQIDAYLHVGESLLRDPFVELHQHFITTEDPTGWRTVTDAEGAMSWDSSATCHTRDCRRAVAVDLRLAATLALRFLDVRA